MFSKDQVLEQAGVSMLAQANQDPQMILKLLGQ
jgi:flagellin